MNNRNRRLDIVLALGLAAIVFLPWYRIEQGFYAFTWLADFPGEPDVAPGILQIFLHGRVWLMAVIAAFGLAIAARLTANPMLRGKLLAIAGGFGVLFLALQGLAIGMTGFMVVFPVLAFLLLDTGQPIWIGLAIVLGFVFPVLGVFGGFAPVFGELFGSRHRYAGVAVSREFSAAVGGGFAPLISGALVQAFAGWGGVAVYMAAIMLVSLVTAIRMPETRDRDLLSESDA